MYCLICVMYCLVSVMYCIVCVICVYLWPMFPSTGLDALAYNRRGMRPER